MEGPLWLVDWHTYSAEKQQQIRDWILANENATEEVRLQVVEDIING